MSPCGCEPRVTTTRSDTARQSDLDAAPRPVCVRKRPQPPRPPGRGGPEGDHARRGMRTSSSPSPRLRSRPRAPTAPKGKEPRRRPRPTWHANVVVALPAPPIATPSAHSTPGRRGQKETACRPEGSVLPHDQTNLGRVVPFLALPAPGGGVPPRLWEEAGRGASSASLNVGWSRPVALTVRMRTQVTTTLGGTARQSDLGRVVPFLALPAPGGGAPPRLWEEVGRGASEALGGGGAGCLRGSGRRRGGARVQHP